MKHTVVLSIGSNSSDRTHQMHSALDWISRELDDVRLSEIYSTPALGNSGGSYLNAVAIGTSDLDAEAFNSRCKGYELAAGRNAECRKKGIVPIDIDLVMFDGDILRQRDYSQEFFLIGYREIMPE